MRILALLPVVALCACPADLSEVCDLPGDVPENVETGQGSATLDGAPFDGPATWSPGSGASIIIGLLTMIVAKDVTGTELDALLSDGALPICVKQGEQSVTPPVGAANLVEGGFVTDAEHTGNVAILSFDDDVLTGRFELSVVNTSGEEREFTDGVFAATRRE